MDSSKLTLPVIVISQFCCTSLWFAGNSVVSELALDYNLPDTALGHLTSAVQFGFIVGTLIFAGLSIADRFSPAKVFVACAILGGIFNLGTIYDGNGLISLLSLRFFTGFFLAGIYPIGMKIAADHFEKGLGKSLGYLVGALVLGTAFPHLLKDITSSFPWKYVLIGTSSFALLGGALMFLFVPDGPFRKAGKAFNVKGITDMFANRPFRSSAFGYFGHMWELYTFWAFVPIILKANFSDNDSTSNVSLWSFLIIGIGGLACILAGYISIKVGIKKTAFYALLLSALCCLISPFILDTTYEPLLLVFLLFWGTMVIADSPLFSTLVAQNAPAEIKGTALTIVNCIGYSITIVSIQLISTLAEEASSNWYFALLAVGPIIGLKTLSKGPLSNI